LQNRNNYDNAVTLHNITPNFTTSLIFAIETDLVQIHMETNGVRK